MYIIVYERHRDSAILLLHANIVQIIYTGIFFWEIFRCKQSARSERVKNEKTDKNRENKKAVLQKP